MIAKHSQSIAEEAIIEADLELAEAGLETALSKVSKDEALVQENNDTVNRMSSLPKGAVSEQSLPSKTGLKSQTAEPFFKPEVNQQKALIKNLETLVETKNRDLFSSKTKGSTRSKKNQDNISSQWNYSSFTREARFSNNVGYGR